MRLVPQPVVERDLVYPRRLFEKTTRKPVVQFPVCGFRDGRMLRDFPERAAFPELLHDASVYNDDDREYVISQSWERTVSPIGPAVAPVQIQQTQPLSLQPVYRAEVFPTECVGVGALGIRTIAYDERTGVFYTEPRQFSTELGPGLYLPEPVVY